ncbi:myb-like protein U [Culex pipiens pallens]|uniref:myb-like protein U n=1 Tax=Culex pipiens pallens TaxID=42434 RepID=UPI001954E0B1|nr:myb-like protein U [Culex pipiens pallens]
MTPPPAKRLRDTSPARGSREAPEGSACLFCEHYRQIIEHQKKVCEEMWEIIRNHQHQNAAKQTLIRHLKEQCRNDLTTSIRRNEPHLEPDENAPASNTTSSKAPPTTAVASSASEGRNEPLQETGENEPDTAGSSNASAPNATLNKAPPTTVAKVVVASSASDLEAPPTTAVASSASKGRNEPHQDTGENEPDTAGSSNASAPNATLSKAPPTTVAKVVASSASERQNEPHQEPDENVSASNATSSKAPPTTAVASSASKGRKEPYQEPDENALDTAGTSKANKALPTTAAKVVASSALKRRNETHQGNALDTAGTLNVGASLAKKSTPTSSNVPPMASTTAAKAVASATKSATVAVKKVNYRPMVEIVNWKEWLHKTRRATMKVENPDGNTSHVGLMGASKAGSYSAKSSVPTTAATSLSQAAASSSSRRQITAMAEPSPSTAKRHRSSESDVAPMASATAAKAVASSASKRRSEPHQQQGGKAPDTAESSKVGASLAKESTPKATSSDVPPIASTKVTRRYRSQSVDNAHAQCFFEPRPDLFAAVDVKVHALKLLLGRAMCSDLENNTAVLDDLLPRIVFVLESKFGTHPHHRDIAAFVERLEHEFPHVKHHGLYSYNRNHRRRLGVLFQKPKREMRRYRPAPRELIEALTGAKA